MSQITSQLTKLKDNIWRVTENIDLVFSELDEEENGKGWYLQKYPGGKTSQLFPTDWAAIKALKQKNVIFKS